MAQFKTSAILELIDKTKDGAKSAINNFKSMEKAADSFSGEAAKGGEAAGKSYEEFSFEVKKSERSLEELNRQLKSGKGDFREIKREIKETEDALEDLSKTNPGKAFRSLSGEGLRKGAVAVGVIGSALTAASAATFGLTNEFAKQSDEIGKFASRVGFATESLSGLQFVVGQTAGDEGLDALNAGLTAFNRRLGELKKGRGELVNLDDNFKRVLLSASGTEDAFVRFIEEARKIEDVSEQAAILDKAFSEAGRKLVNFVRTSDTEIKGLLDEANSLGIIITDEDAEKAARFRDEVDKLKQGFRGLGITIGGSLIGPFTEFFEDVALPKIKEFQAFISEIDAQDIERAFENIAGFLESSLTAITGIAKVAGRVVDLVTTDDEEIKQREVQDVISQKRADRTSQIGPLGVGLLAGGLKNAISLEQDTQDAQEQVRLMREQNEILRGLSSKTGINANDGGVADSETRSTDVYGSGLGRGLDTGQEFTVTNGG